MNDLKSHWEKIYSTKSPQEVSWTEAVPEVSLGFIQNFHLPLSARIIDIGGGDSHLAEHLLALGFQNISVLDISAAALERAQNRLGTKAKNVKWIEADINNFVPGPTFDLWHDRAAFHFLTNENDVQGYVAKSTAALKSGGYLLVGTFSDKGPEKCSGLPVQQYSETSLGSTFGGSLQKLGCKTVEHITPFQTPQLFTFCSFQKL